MTERSPLKLTTLDRLLETPAPPHYAAQVRPVGPDDAAALPVSLLFGEATPDYDSFVVPQNTTTQERTRSALNQLNTAVAADMSANTTHLAHITDERRNLKHAVLTIHRDAIADTAREDAQAVAKRKRDRDIERRRLDSEERADTAGLADRNQCRHELLQTASNKEDGVQRDAEAAIQALTAAGRTCLTTQHELLDLDRELSNVESSRAQLSNLIATLQGERNAAEPAFEVRSAELQRAERSLANADDVLRTFQAEMESRDYQYRTKPFTNPPKVGADTPEQERTAIIADVTERMGSYGNTITPYTREDKQRLAALTERAHSEAQACARARAAYQPVVEYIESRKAKQQQATSDVAGLDLMAADISRRLASTGERYRGEKEVLLAAQQQVIQALSNLQEVNATLTRETQAIRANPQGMVTDRSQVPLDASKVNKEGYMIQAVRGSGGNKQPEVVYTRARA